MNRREFLKGGGYLAIIGALEGCAPKPLKPSSIIATLTPKPTEQLPEPTEQKPPPVELPKQFSGQFINKDYLLNEINIPVFNPTPVPPTENVSENEETSTEYARKHFVIKSLDTSNPLDVLKYTLAQAPKLVINGGVTWFQPGLNGEKTAFAGLSYYREQLEITKSETQNVLNMENAFPKKLILKNGSGITIIGRGEDGNIAIAFEEYQPRGEVNFSEPRIRLAVLTSDELQLLSDYKYLQRLSYEGGADSFTFTETGGVQRTVVLNTISKDIMDLIYNEAGEGWYEQLPETIEGGIVKKYGLFPEPVIPKLDPERDGLPDGFDWRNARLKILNLKPDGKNFNNLYPGDPTAAVIFALDENSGTVLTVRYDREWQWKIPGLKDEADAISWNFGTAVPGPFWLDNPPPGYYDIIKKDFNLGIIHIGLDWDGYEPEEGKENNGYKDYTKRQILKLRELGIKTLRSHALIYPAHIPNWLYDKYKKGQLSSEILISYLRKHVESVINLVKTYSGDMKREWTVVSEPYKDPYTYGIKGPDIFMKILGPEYIDMIFDWVDELDPESILIFEDTLNHGTDNWNGYNTAQTKDIIGRLKTKEYARKIKLGIEAQIDADKRPNKKDMINTLRSYSFPIIITSAVVNMKNIPGSDDKRQKLQADICEDLIDACYQVGGTSFSWWDTIGDKYNSLDQPEYGGDSNADPTLFDDNLKPKEAYYRIQDRLMEIITS